jgi:hypothetical protein
MIEDTEKTMWRELRRAGRPETITQEAYDFRDRHLRRLVRLAPGERAEAQDLWDYSQDLQYTDIQSGLLAYLLPFCLEAWRADLRGTHSGYGGFVEYFYPVLAKSEVFSKHLTPRQTAAVSDYIRESILDEIDDQRGLSFTGTKARPCRWFGALTTYGVLLPDIEQLWAAWWSLDTVGRAVATAQYVSCLMYSDIENPVFAAWTPDGGGGPPCLWEFAGHLYTNRWLETNVEFLRGTLTLERVTEVLVRAAGRLANNPEHDVAAEMVADLPLCADVIQARCQELPRLLETTQEPAKGFEWSK